MEEIKTNNKKLKKLKKLIANGKEGEVLEILANSISMENPYFYNKLVMLSNQYNSIQNREMLNLPYNCSEKHKVVYSILKLIEEIEKSENEFEFDFDTELSRKLKNRVIIISVPLGAFAFLLATGLLSTALAVALLAIILIFIIASILMSVSD